MRRLNLALKTNAASDLPVKVIQFGTGRLLRGLVDWLIYKANAQGQFNGRVLALQDNSNDKTVADFEAQDCLYTTVLYDRNDGVVAEDVINTLAKVVDPKDDWEYVLAQCMQPEIKYIFSDTCVAGLSFEAEDAFNADVCPKSFAGKLTQVLYERYLCFDGAPESGLCIVPCEAVLNNGERLRDLVLLHGATQMLGEGFRNYVLQHCHFLTSVVDRVVTKPDAGGAAAFAEHHGYTDELQICAGNEWTFTIKEQEGPAQELADLLGLQLKADITPCSLRQQRIRQGVCACHVPTAFLQGLETANQMMTDAVSGLFVRSLICDEIIPSLPKGYKAQLTFAAAIAESLSCPDLHCFLADRLCYAQLQFREYVLPTLLEARSRGVLPKKLCFALASVVALYKNMEELEPGYFAVGRPNSKSKVKTRDSSINVEIMQRAWSMYEKSEASAVVVVKIILADRRLWGYDLSYDNGLCALTAHLLHAIISDGVVATMRDLLDNN